jgi:predicted GNAT family acetyltransferase
VSKSLYARYINEHSGDHILEDERGFATYRFLNEKQCYIVDIFVLSEHRKQGVAKDFADRIAADAKIKGRKELLGSVVPGLKHSTTSLKVLLAYGMQLERCDANIIIMKKDL